MDEDGALELEHPCERLQQGVDVVARDDADVGDPEILEELARAGEVHHRAPQPLAPHHRGRPDHGDRAPEPIPGRLARLPGPAQLDLREVRRERSDGRADRHLVVVEDDQHRRPPVADVVERLERQARHQRRVANDHRDALRAAADVAGRGQALGDGQAGPRVTAVEHVVLALGSAREATDAVDLAQRPEPLEAPGEQLVGIRLVAGVPHDLVARRVEHAVEGDRDLYDAERRAQMAAGLRNRGDDRLADLGGEPRELGLAEATEIGGPVESGENRLGHGRDCCSWLPAQRRRARPAPV